VDVWPSLCSVSTEAKHKLQARLLMRIRRLCGKALNPDLSVQNSTSETIVKGLGAIRVESSDFQAAGGRMTATQEGNEHRRIPLASPSSRCSADSALQLFAKTLATALVKKKKLRDHEKLAYRQNRVYSHRRPYK